MSAFMKSKGAASSAAFALFIILYAAARAQQPPPATPKPAPPAAAAPAAPPPKNGPTDVLVLVPTLQSPVDLHAYVTVMGELVKFDPAEIVRKAKDYKLDLPADAVAKYTGRPALIATSVINEKFVDLAKRLPPPLTAEEETYQKMMKQVGPAFAALRGGIDGSNAEAATKNAAV